MNTRRIILGACLLAAGLPAAADATGQAVMHSFQFRLTDLATDDGVTPSATWQQPFDDLWTTGQETSATGWQAFGDILTPNYGPANRLDHSVSYPSGLISERASAHGRASGFASASTLGVNSQADTGQSNVGLANSMRSFVLSPQTEASFTASFDYWINLSGFVWQTQPSAGPSYFQQSAASAIARIDVFTSDGSFHRWADLQKAFAVPFPDSSASMSGSDLLTVVIRNDSDLARTYRVQSGLNVIASETPALPVPEPASYALLLGGLAAIGWAARRRQRASS